MEVIDLTLSDGEGGEEDLFPELFVSENDRLNDEQLQALEKYVLDRGTAAAAAAARQKEEKQQTREKNARIPLHALRPRRTTSMNAHYMIKSFTEHLNGVDKEGRFKRTKAA